MRQPRAGGVVIRGGCGPACAGARVGSGPAEAWCPRGGDAGPDGSGVRWSVRMVQDGGWWTVLVCEEPERQNPFRVVARSCLGDGEEEKAQTDAAAASESGPAGADAELLHVMRPLRRAGCGGTVRDGVMWLGGALGRVGAGCCIRVDEQAARGGECGVAPIRIGALPLVSMQTTGCTCNRLGAVAQVEVRETTGVRRERH